MVYYFLPSRAYGLLLLGGTTIFYLSIDFLRLKLNPVKAGFIILFGSFLRKEERHALSGGSYLLLAALFSMLFYEKAVFIAAISFLAVGDTAAALVGLSMGRLRVFKKTLEGTLAGLAACIGVAVVVTHLDPSGFPLLVGILGALAASVVEALPFEVNDNVVIPVLSGAVMQLSNIVIH